MMRLEALNAELGKQSPLAPIIWIASDEALLRIETCDQVREAARRQSFTERQVFQVERGFKLDLLLAEANATSLFASRRLLELRLTGKPGKELGDALALAVSKLPEDIRLLVASPRLDRATTESGWFGKVMRQGWVVAIPVIDRARLPAWIGERLARSQQRAEGAVLQLIAERVEGNLLAAEQEVRKLALLLPPGQLDPQAVRAAVLDVARWDVFDLVEAALSGDTARTVRCLAGLRAEGVALPVLLWALADTVRTLLRLTVAQAEGRPLAQALRAARVWGERERLYPVALRRLNRPTVLSLLKQCARADRACKGLGHHDPHQAIEAIALTLASAPALQPLES